MRRRVAVPKEWRGRETSWMRAMFRVYRDALARRAWRRRCAGASIAKGAIVLGDVSAITVRPGAVIEAGAVLSTQYGGVIDIGERTRICRGGMVLSYGGFVRIGRESSVNPYSILYGHGGLTIGDYVRIAAHSVIVPANHTYTDASRPIHAQPLTKKGIVLGNDIWIGAGVYILDGVCIGDGCVVGAGSVVTRNLEPFTVNVGNPCSMVKRRSETLT